MSNIAAAVDRTSASYDGSVSIVTWDGFAIAGDVGLAIRYAAWSDKTFVVSDTFAGAPSIAIEGSNDGTNWVSLSNRQGTAMNFSAPGMNTSQDRPVYIRPRMTAGTGGASIKVTVACHRVDLPGKGW